MNCFPSDESAGASASSRRCRRAAGVQHQPEAGLLAHQRAAQAQRITKRLADEVLLDAYIKAGLGSEVRRFFRGAAPGGSSAGKKPRRAP